MKPGPEADRLYVQYMLERINRIDQYVSGDVSVLRRTPLVQDAVVRNLQTLVESSQRLSESTKHTEPGIDWRGMAGLRNVLVHAYLGIDADVICRIVAEEIPRLRAALERIAERLEPGGA